MGDEKEGVTALMKSAIEAPKRDNTDYHHAIAAVRRAFAEADAAFGPEMLVSTKRKWKRNGDYVVKMTFKKKAPGD
ncbi:MAG TPA: hypothetical protein VGN93_07875 [Shinella sp.]|uniref:hypothetical protein n=1 Tax=Shinella sp. TaxID=1870904 RepID=UPI002E1653FF|nr:hypothetical protein [Shinella sp.]